MASYRCKYCNQSPNGWVTLAGIKRPTTVKRCPSPLMKFIGGNCVWVKL